MSLLFAAKKKYNRLSDQYGSLKSIINVLVKKGTTTGGVAFFERERIKKSLKSCWCDEKNVQSSILTLVLSSLVLLSLFLLPPFFSCDWFYEAVTLSLHYILYRLYSETSLPSIPQVLLHIILVTVSSKTWNFQRYFVIEKSELFVTNRSSEGPKTPSKRGFTGSLSPRFLGYGAIQINAGSLMLKRTNFVAHHSSFFDFLLLLDSVDNARDTHKKVENTFSKYSTSLQHWSLFFAVFSHVEH